MPFMPDTGSSTREASGDGPRATPRPPASAPTPHSLLTVKEAQDEIDARTTTLPPRRVPLSEALDCLIADTIVADRDSPPFHKALVDGYAVRSADCSDLAGASLRVTEEIYAGQSASRQLNQGEAVGIMTGAPLPEGADAVVMHERTTRDGDLVRIEPGTVSPGANRLPKGREMRAGDTVIQSGTRLRTIELAVLAAIGHTSPLVIPRPRVAIVTTGDEIVPPAQAPGPSQIRDSNSTYLESKVRQSLGISRTWCAVPDTEQDLTQSLGEALEWSDMLLVCGGVSAGKKDLVPRVLQNLGTTDIFHKVKIRPGKPLWFGLAPSRTDPMSTDSFRPLVFGLPGNPASVLATSLLFVSRAYAKLAGKEPLIPRGDDPAHLTKPVPHRGDRASYLPAREWYDEPSGDSVIEVLDWAGSADLRTFLQANALAEFPPGDQLWEGQITYLWLDEPWV
jgi:molybdopterin molybdotransferase